MFSTQQNLTKKKPKCNKDNFSGSCLVYPDNTGKRTAEGGLRIQGKYKKTLPSNTLLTIITVVHNQAHTLEQCILSVLEQDYDNVEYIIIDGGSTDDTLEIIKKYEDAIDYYISEPDTGIYNAMNKGIALASGDVINFMNSDDYFLPNVFEEYANILKNNNIKIVTALANIVDENGELLYEEYHDINTISFRAIPHQSAFIKKEVFEICGNYDEKYSIVADHAFFIDTYLAFHKTNFFHIPMPTIVYYRYGMSMREEPKKNKEVLSLMEEKYGHILGLPHDLIVKMYYEGINQNNYQDIAIALKKKIYGGDDNNVQKIAFQLYEQIIEQAINFQKETATILSRIENNWWYKFGQATKFQKLKVLLFFPLRRILKLI